MAALRYEQALLVAMLAGIWCDHLGDLERWAGGSCSAAPLACHQQAGGQDCMHTGWLSAVLLSYCTACSPHSVAAAASKHSCTSCFCRWMTACARATPTSGRWAMPWKCR